jgi:hypothetical protein
MDDRQPLTRHLTTDGNHRRGKLVGDDPTKKLSDTDRWTNTFIRQQGGVGVPEWAVHLAPGWFAPPKYHGWGV